MSDLSLVPFEELMGEVHKRFDSAIFVGIIDKAPNVFNIKRLFKGSRMSCIAVCDLMKDVIKDDLYNTWKKDEEDEMQP